MTTKPIAAEPIAAKPRALLSWSSGKDAAWALHVLREAGEYEVVGLLTTLDGAQDRVAMHAVAGALLAAQAAAVGLPLLTAALPWPCPNGEYEAATGRVLERARADWGITHVAFGDLYLEDIRRYRERQMGERGLTPLFPLWGRPTGALAREMIAGGLRARLVCVDPARLPPSLAGRAFDAALLADLPPDVDPCGEGGEFHTFAHDGPMFIRPVPVAQAGTIARDGFVFADLLPQKED